MKNIDFLKSSLIAHRGVHNSKIAENTLPSFMKCVHNSYIIELDIHILKDDTIVVYHDYNLKRLTGINRVIETLNINELNKIKLKNKYRVPTLSQVLKVVGGKVPILIEIKDLNNNDHFENKLMELLKDYNGEIAIQSINPYVLKWLRKTKYPVGQIINREKNISMINIVFNKILNKVDFISCNIKNINEDISKKIRNRFFLIGWTVKTKSELEKYTPFCDNLICEKIL